MNKFWERYFCTQIYSTSLRVLNWGGSAILLIKRKICDIWNDFIKKLIILRSDRYINFIKLLTLMKICSTNRRANASNSTELISVPRQTRVRFSRPQSGYAFKTTNTFRYKKNIYQSHVMNFMNMTWYTSANFPKVFITCFCLGAKGVIDIYWHEKTLKCILITFYDWLGTRYIWLLWKFDITFLGKIKKYIDSQLIFI